MKLRTKRLCPRGVLVSLFLFSACDPGEDTRDPGEDTSGSQSFLSTDAAAGAWKGPEGDAGSSCAPSPAVVIPQATASTQCPCTRRPQVAPNQFCRWGDGTAVKGRVGVEGGEVRLSGTASTVGVPMRVNIPRGALSHSQEIQLTELKTPPPSAYVDYSPVYRVDPLELVLEVPGQIVVPWGSAAQTTSDPSFGLYRADSVEGPFERIPDSYTNAGFFQATLMRGGYYLAAYVKPASLEHCP